MEDQSSGFTFPKILVAFLALCVATAYLSWGLHMNFGDLLFVEGILVLAFGAYVASGATNLRRKTYRNEVEYPDGEKELLEEQSGRKRTRGIELIIVGVVMIFLSIIYDYL